MDQKSDKFDVIQSPFARLREKLSDIEPALPGIDLTIGEPRHAMPGFVGEILQKYNADFAKYPPIQGTEGLRQSISEWIKLRYPVLENCEGVEEIVLPLNGSREGLFSAQFMAVSRKTYKKQPAVLIPNPFYQVYVAGALAAGAKPIFLNSTRANGFLPNLDELEKQDLSDVAAFFLCSPSNPEGAVASQEYLDRAISLSRKYNFMLFCDECYSEIYVDVPPKGGLEVAYSLDNSFQNVVAFNSLSKRSNLPGLRSGFAAGDPDFMKAFAKFRNVSCPQIPLPIQHASEAIWAEETHSVASRTLYQQKFDIVDKILKPLLSIEIPEGGFCLWLDVRQFGGGEAVAERLWKDSGVKVLPGAYLAQQDDKEQNPCLDYIRIALVQDLETTREAMERIVKVLS